MTRLEELQEINTCLTVLLADPQPGLMTWQQAVQRQVAKIGAFLVPQPRPDKIINSYDDMMQVLADVTFPNTVFDFDWKFHVEPFDASSRSGWLVHCSFRRPDANSGVQGRGRGRDEIIWQGQSESGVVKTLWVLFKMLVDHEAMESFKYQGFRPFNPHNTMGELQLPFIARGNKDF